VLFGDDRRVGTVEPQDVGALHPAAIGLPPGGDIAQHPGFVVGQFAWVHLEAHVPLRGDPGPEPDIQNAPGRMAFAGPDMAAGHRHRQEERGVVLDLQPLQRIV